MERHRCEKCRNPIRESPRARRAASGVTWFHADCWDAVCSDEQRDYEREVRSRGLAGLLARYVFTAPARARAASSLPMVG